MRTGTTRTTTREALRDRPKGPSDGTHRVMRGGSYLCHASYCRRYRVSARQGTEPVVVGGQSRLPGRGRRASAVGAVAMTAGDDATVEMTTGLSSPVLAAVAPERWAPSFFGVVPEGGVRRRPSDLVHLVLAIVLIVACVVVTDGFTARADASVPVARATSRAGSAPSGPGCSSPAPSARSSSSSERSSLTRNLPPGAHPRRRGVCSRRCVSVALASLVDVDAVRRGGGTGRRIALGRLGGVAGGRRRPCSCRPRPTSCGRPGERCAWSRCWPCSARCSPAIGPLASILGARRGRLGDRGRRRAW